MLLTFGTVVALPAVGTDAVALGGARVMSELVVPRPTEVGAARAVVVLVTHDTVLVAEGRVRAAVLLLVPVRAHVQPLLRRQPRDQRLAGSDTTCENKTRRQTFATKQRPDHIAAASPEAHLTKYRSVECHNPTSTGDFKGREI